MLWFAVQFVRSFVECCRRQSRSLGGRTVLWFAVQFVRSVQCCRRQSRRHGVGLCCGLQCSSFVRSFVQFSVVVVSLIVSVAGLCCGLQCSSVQCCRQSRSFGGRAVLWFCSAVRTFVRSVSSSV